LALQFKLDRSNFRSRKPVIQDELDDIFSTEQGFIIWYVEFEDLFDESDEIREFITITLEGFNCVFQSFQIDDFRKLIFRFHPKVGHLVLGLDKEIWMFICHLDEEFEGR
jgi:hypothetical protein